MVPAPPDPCAHPACAAAGSGGLLAALGRGDIDGAIALGLLQFEVPAAGACCQPCAVAVAGIIAARDERLAALAARERHRQRSERLASRARQREAARRGTPGVAGSAPLPPAAAAALARAKARAGKPR